MKTTVALLIGAIATAVTSVHTTSALSTTTTSSSSASASFLAFKAKHGLRALQDVSLSPFENCLSTNRSLTADIYFTPASSGYVDFATGVNSRIDRRPAAVFFAQTENDVVSAVNCAVRNGLSPVPRGGGHSYEVLSSMDGSLVIDLASMNAVARLSEDAASQTAVFSVQGGARLGRVYNEIFSKGGYNFNAGTCPGVGIGGHVSGGGYGMVSRMYGMAADMVVGLRVVLASGEIVDATESKNADLFWALRGGGAGSYGIVTEFRIKTHKIPISTMFTIYYDNSVTFQLMRAWMDYFPTSDPRMTTQMNVDRGGTTFRGQFLGPLWELSEMLEKSGMLSHGGIKYDVRTDKCNAVGTKKFMWRDTCGQPDDASFLNTVNHPGRDDKGYAKLKSAYASVKLSDAGIRTVIDQLNRAPQDYNWIQFEALGGVFSWRPVSYTPWAGRDAVFSVQLYVNAQKGESENSVGRQWIRGFAAAIAPHMNGRAYQNYCDLEIGPNYGEAYWGKDNFERLKQIKKVYDPTNIFKNAQSVPLP